MHEQLVKNIIESYMHTGTNYTFLSFSTDP